MNLIIEDLTLFETFQSLSENSFINHDKNVAKIENAIGIVDKKIQNASKNGHDYLLRQKEILKTKHKEALEKRSDFRINQNKIMDELHKKAIDEMVQKHLASQQQSNDNKDDSKYDENNPKHKEIIKQYHQKHMEKVRLAKQNKTLKEAVEGRLPATVQAALINKEKKDNELAAKKQQLNSTIIQKNSFNNLKLMKRKSDSKK